MPRPETKEDIKQIHEIASRLQELGAPQKIVDKIHAWVNQEAKRLRDEVRSHSRQ